MKRIFFEMTGFSEKILNGVVDVVSHLNLDDGYRTTVELYDNHEVIFENYYEITGTEEAEETVSGVSIILDGRHISSITIYPDNILDVCEIAAKIITFYFG